MEPQQGDHLQDDFKGQGESRTGLELWQCERKGMNGFNT